MRSLGPAGLRAQRVMFETASCWGVGLGMGEKHDGEKHDLPQLLTIWAWSQQGKRKNMIMLHPL